jgi:ketosteroid isomerase-like protein
MRCASAALPLVLVTLSCVRASATRPGAADHRTAADSAGAAATVLRMENDWARALMRHDPTPIAAIVADDFTATGPRGRVSDKAQLLDDVRRDTTEFEATNEGMRARVYGDAAVVTGTAVIRERARDGTISESRERFTDTYVRRGGRWPCIAIHNSEIAAC